MPIKRSFIKKIFGQMRVRLTFYVVVGVLIVAVPVVLVLASWSLSDMKKDEYGHLESMLAIIVGDNGHYDLVEDSQIKEVVPLLMQQFPSVGSVELLSDKEIKRLDEAQAGYVYRLFEKGEDNWLKIKLNDAYFKERYDQLLGRYLLLLLLLVVISIVVVWLSAGKLVMFVDGASRFINKLGIGAEERSFKDTGTVRELSNLKDSVNLVADRFYMQSRDINKSFDEINRLTQVFENSPSLIITLDQDASVKYLNKAMKDLLSDVYSDADVLSLMPEETEVLVNASILENRAYQGIETKIDGRSYLWSVIPMPSQTIVNCYGVDITEVRDAESITETAYLDSMIARDESEAKSVFLANMSHEIRTPLTAILGFSESLLESGQSMEERVIAINTVIRNAQHLLHIINDLLDITKIEAGQVVVALNKVSLISVLQDVYFNFKSLAKVKKLGFSLDVTSLLPALIVSDEGRLKQILFNLCTNAIKFTEIGEVKVSVEFDSVTSELAINVEDTGVGISENELDSVFHRFEQVDKSHSRKYGGVGLGLYITHEIVERFGGSISVTSKVNQGTRFRVVIKAEVCQGADFVEKIDFSQPEITQDLYQAEKYTGNVLLVEDNLDNQNLIYMYLTKIGARVSVANNGLEAAELARSQVFDVILMDMQMPVMDGVEATRGIRATGYNHPIVMLTANVLKEDIDLCFEAGCDDYLTKPVERENFSAFVSKYLKSAEQLEGNTDPVVSDLASEGPEFYNIVKAYVRQLPGDLEKVVSVFKAGDMEDLKGKVHSMKGTSGNMGYLEYSALCAQVEFAITKEDNEEIGVLLAMLASMKERIVAGVPAEELH